MSLSDASLEGILHKKHYQRMWNLGVFFISEHCWNKRCLIVHNLTYHLTPNLVNFGIIQKMLDMEWPGNEWHTLWIFNQRIPCFLTILLWRTLVGATWDEGRYTFNLWWGVMKGASWNEYFSLPCIHWVLYVGTTADEDIGIVLEPFSVLWDMCLTRWMLGHKWG